jgi:hypothetical protein
MKLETATTAGSRRFLILGWICSAIPILMMGVGAIIMAITNEAAVAQGLAKYGYPTHVGPTILALEISCALIYAIPQTAVLGAILITGYLGGAVATHVRAGEPQWFIPVVLAAIAWLGILLRDKRLRQLLFVRR